MQRFPIEENIPNIKVLAEQMVRTSFGFELDDLENKSESVLKKLKKNNSSKILKKNSYNSKVPIQKTNKKLNRYDSDLSILPNNISYTKSKKISNYSKINSLEIGKMQEGNSNIINTNTNNNTNINTGANLNSNLNTNNNLNNDNNINENDLYSDKNSQIYPINENSSNVSSNNIKDNIENKDNKEKNEKNEYNEVNQSEFNDSKVIKKDKNITVEVINPTLLKKYRNDSFDDEDININNKQNINRNNKAKKGKMSKSTLYEREMRNLQRKKTKLEKKRVQLQLEKMKDLKPGPEMNPYSEELIERQEIYIKIHSLKISKIILNEENKKIMQIQKEEEELKKDISRNKIFDQEEWDNFIEKQYLWKDEKEFKQKAEQIKRNNQYKKYLFKPKIDAKSRALIKDLQYGNEDVIDEVFIRLFNDYEEHKERQKLRDDQSLPSFKPKISKNSSQKNLNINLKFPNRSGTTPLIPLRNNDNLKKKYSIASSKVIGNKKTEKAKSQKLFCDLYNNNIEKYLVNNKSDKKKPLINRTQPTQYTNNTHSNGNMTELNTDLI